MKLLFLISVIHITTLISGFWLRFELKVRIFHRTIFTTRVHDYQSVCVLWIQIYEDRRWYYRSRFFCVPVRRMNISFIHLNNGSLFFSKAFRISQKIFFQLLNIRFSHKYILFVSILLQPKLILFIIFGRFSWLVSCAKLLWIRRRMLMYIVYTFNIYGFLSWRRYVASTRSVVNCWIKYKI